MIELRNILSDKNKEVSKKLLFLERIAFIYS